MSNRDRGFQPEGWCNRMTGATPLGLARSFAVDNFDGEDLDAALKTVSVFESDPRAAKRYLQSYITEFSDSQDYFRWAQFKALFFKSTCSGSEMKRRLRAEEKFLASERSCKRTNRRLRFYWKYPNRENPVYRVILTRARQMIEQVLGNFTETTLSHLIELSRPGGGVAIGTRPKQRDATSLPFKLGSHDLVCGPRALPYARMLVETSPTWLQLNADTEKWWSRDFSSPDRNLECGYKCRYELTSANKISFVSKDAETSRTIAVEASLNVCLQLGVHSYLLRRLKSFGVDLTRQQRNQELARLGAQEWCSANPFCTLDLSAASDSVSVALVERLLPREWFEYLGDLRSADYMMGGARGSYEKWSSMGNGYTFVLETLIFWALARACESFTGVVSDVSVYGDDIILRRSNAALLIEVLKYCGFSVNTDKSFCFGPFRESCGEDFYGNERVVPTYIRGLDTLRPTDIYRVVNRTLSRLVLRWGTALHYLFQEHRRVCPVLYGLANEDDSSCVFVSVQEAKRRGVLKWHPDWQTWRFKVASFSPSLRKPGRLAAYAAQLLGPNPDGFRHKEDDPLASIRRRGRWVLIRRTPGRSFA